MRPEDLCLTDALGVVLQAPWGYGKRWWSQHWQQAFAHTLCLDTAFAFSDDYFAALRQACQQANLPEPDPLKPLEWFQSLPAGLGIFIDNWESQEALLAVREFWQVLWQVPQQQLTVVLGTRKRPQFELTRWVAAGGQFFDASQLAWSLEQAQDFWQQKGLDWQASDQQIWLHTQGWPLGLILSQRYRAGDLSELSYRQLIAQACRAQLPAFISQIAYYWQAESQAQLADWNLLPRQLSPAMSQFLAQHSQQEAAYWLWQATQESERLSQSRALLQRALRLTGAIHPLRLRILTRLAHDASLKGHFELLDQSLAAGASLLEDSSTVDCAAWYYLQANRYRQVCKYPESRACIEALMALNAQDPVIMNFQTRALILQGLMAYQQGQYAQTRDYYLAAMHLAQADHNLAMGLELTVMLAFLDALTGTVAEPLPADLEAQIKKLPLESQPLIWLNLTFYQILGERVDLQSAQSLLQRVRQTSLALAWSSLDPLIADVEARLLRYFKQEQQALACHQQALNNLDPESFDFLFARLNYALTLIRVQQKPQAEQILSEICERAQSNGSLIILREASAALSALSPAVEPLGVASNHKPYREPFLQMSQRPAVETPGWLKIQCFGAFQVSINQTQIQRWPRKRARHLLIHLLVHPHGVHRESLADWLTGSDDLDAALRSLDVHIHALRKVLEPQRKGKQASQYILFQDACYRFNWDCVYEWDAARFDQLYQGWLRQKQDPVPATLALADEALSLYQGPFLPDLEFADEWIAERESFARRALDLLRWRLHIHVGQAQYEQAEALIEQWLSWDVLDEAAYAQAFEIALAMQDKSRLQGMLQRLEQTFYKELELPVPDALLKQYQDMLDQLAST